MEQGAVIRSSTNGMAIASMVLGIMWLAGIGSLLALIFGLKARKQIDSSHGTQGGRGMSTAGIVLGIVGIAGAVIYWAIVVIAVIHGTSTTYQGY
jgi:Domain of unknown function (DUF4190)